MRINVEEVFSNLFFGRPHSDCVIVAKKNRIETMFPERSAILPNFVGFQIFVVKSLFPFLSFIGPFVKK